MLRPFIPARDHAHSRRFYEALGFVADYADETLVFLSNGEAGFILQNFYVKDWAENCMLQLTVPDCAAWWRAHDPATVATEFGTRPPIPPALQPWGRTVGFIHDPSGVLWHVTE